MDALCLESCTTSIICKENSKQVEGGKYDQKISPEEAYQTQPNQELQNLYLLTLLAHNILYLYLILITLYLATLNTLHP